MAKKFIAIFIVISYIIFYILNLPKVTTKTSDTINVSFSPIQTNIISVKPIYLTISDIKYTIKPVANYKISATAISSKRYYFDNKSKLSKYDLVLGWGNLGEQKVINNIRFTQSGRQYFYSNKSNSSLNNSYIVTHSSNNHIVHSNKNIEKAIKSINKGDRVILEGYLVDITSSNFSWNSSLSRSDTGDESSEIIYVNKVTVNNKVYN